MRQSLIGRFGIRKACREIGDTGAIVTPPLFLGRGAACRALGVGACRGFLGLVAGGCILSFLLFAAILPTAAQENSPPAAPTSTPANTPAKADVPFLLFVPQHPSKTDKREIEFNTLLREPMREMLGSRYQVLTFGMEQSFVKQALLDHEIPVSELTADPIQPETFRHLAYASGARYLLIIGTSFDAGAARIDMRFQENVSPQQWRTLLAEQIAVETSVGKRRLKTNQLIDLTVDAVADRIGIPSDLSKSLNKKMVSAALTKLEKKDKTAKQNTKNTPPSADDLAQSAPPDTAPLPVHSASAPAKKTDTTTRAATQPTDTGAKAGQSALPSAGNSGGKPPADTGTARRTPLGADAALSPFTADTAPGRANLLPTAPPPAAADRPDNEALATHFRQTGDLANVITALRRAINERPRDMTLRRQLIQAYEDRSLPAAAQAEADRALQLAPKDAGLLRLRGDTLLARGETGPAMQAYRQAVQLNPNDVTAQVALGDALLADDKYDDAVAAYRSASANDPKSPLPHRRLARALAGRAVSDTTQYAVSLEEIKKARSLTPTTDTETYLGDYIALMREMEARLHALLDELQNVYMETANGKRTTADAKRAAQGLKARTEAAADYLENLPPAAGQDATHANYLQGAALALQAISLFHDYLDKGDTNTEEQLKSARVDALRALSAADKRLRAARPATDTPRVGGNDDTATSAGP